MLWKPNLSVHVKMAKLASIPPRWAKQAPNQPKMVTNGGVDLVEVCWGKDGSLASVGEKIEVSGRLKVDKKFSNSPKMG